MAITLQQFPTSPNMGNNNLVYAVTSTTSSAAQFQFVCDIKDENGVLIQRLKQQPNPSAKGVFDIGNIIPNQLGPTDNVWKIDDATLNSSCGADINIFFGEEYANTTTDVPVLYNGSGTPGDPGVGIPTQINFLVDGLVNPNDAVDFNFNSGSKYAEEDPLDDVTFNHQFGLTMFDSSSVRLGDYHTISFLNGNTTGNGDDPNSAMDVFAVTFKQYDSAGVLGSTDIIYNLAGPRTSNPVTTFWNSVYTSQDSTTRLIHFPAGPQNLVDHGITLDSDLAYYTAEFTAQATDGLPNESGVWGSYRFDVVDPNCGYDGVRFAYKNQYGVWDYFNFSLAETTNSTIQRKQYEQTFVDYSTTSNSVTYDKARRGKSQYYNQVNKLHSASTDFLSQEDADNLRELFFSTNVYIQDGGEFIPVVIENANIVEKTNPRSQKLFRFEAQYRLANEIRARR